MLILYLRADQPTTGTLRLSGPADLGKVFTAAEWATAINSQRGTNTPARAATEDSGRIVGELVNARTENDVLLVDLVPPPNASSDNNRDEDPKYPMLDWRYEVSAGTTRLGYWEWVKHQKESNDAHDEEEIA